MIFSQFLSKLKKSEAESGHSQQTLVHPHIQEAAITRQEPRQASSSHARTSFHRKDPALYEFDGIRGRVPELSKLENLLANQAYTYQEIFLSCANFDSPKYHYDWWLFPIPTTQGTRTAEFYALDNHETETLIANKEFMDKYFVCVSMYLSKQINERWNQYPVRYGKLVASLMHFIQSTADKPDYAEMHQYLGELAHKAYRFGMEFVYTHCRNHLDSWWDAYTCRQLDELGCRIANNLIPNHPMADSSESSSRARPRKD